MLRYAADRRPLERKKKNQTTENLAFWPLLLYLHGERTNVVERRTSVVES